ncbi:DUF6299 family protein [Streptomyces sp. NBC_00208]|uniref:DUF6299 family protein n=1 Tax=Streptomyces sp. NBC_00208 TaxID=2975681 RepID=UPI002E2D8595|nr:DUF6299 family protein [Streptomyces sp. NBC_00208]
MRVQLALAQAVHAPPVGPGLVGGTAIFEKSWPDDHGELRKSNPAVSRWAAALAGIRPSRLQGLWYPSQRLRSPGESRLVTSASLWRAVVRPAVRARETSPRQPLVPVLVPYGYGQVAYCALQLLRSSFPPPRHLVELQEGSYDQGDRQVRGSLVAAGVVAIGGALLTAAADPVGAADVQAVSAAPTGTVSTDGTVTLSGTYRCSPLSGAGPVFVSSTVRAGEVRQGIGGTAATCDGVEHTWVNQDKPVHGAPVAPGPAEVEATLVHLDTRSGLPMPRIIVTDRHEIELRPAKG